jgi:anthranilate phosphoribosyltransferase
MPGAFLLTETPVTVLSTIQRLLDGHDLSGDEALAVATEIMRGDVAAPQLGALLALLRARGETSDVIYGFARALRDNVQRVCVQIDSLVDTCGTGGDGRGTFNVSTVSALVAAGAGCRVAKHGNRRVSSRCGSADVLEALGVRVDLPTEDATKQLQTAGIAFLFAPHYHPALRKLESVRRDLGFRTIFNLVGPLANPAGVTRQVVGVFDRSLSRPIADVLKRLGVVHALVVHGADGTDEITTQGPSHICELKSGAIAEYDVHPEQFGLPCCDMDQLAGGSAADNAAIALRVLGGERCPARDIVLLNAGAAIYVASRADSLAEGVLLAAQAIDNGSALDRLDQLRCYRSAEPA